MSLWSSVDLSHKLNELRLIYKFLFWTKLSQVKPCEPDWNVLNSTNFDKESLSGYISSSQSQVSCHALFFKF